jgi:integrating conjugative element protein (TIGR03761 family)
MTTKKKTAAKSEGLFPTSPESPFEDQFDLEEGRRLAGDLYNAENPDPADPAFPLLMRIWEAEEALEHAKHLNNLRGGAENNVPFNIASQRPGRLGKATEMALHTFQSQRLFTGRKRADGVKGIPGFMTFASACFRVWLLTANNNPFADYLLIRITDEMIQIRSEIEKQVKKFKTVLDERSKKGLSHSIAESDKPLVIGGISFGSPYGYQACELLTDFDYFVRVISTLEDVGQIKTDESRVQKEAMQHRLRGFIYQNVRMADILTSEKLSQLSRDDFSLEATDEGKIRAALASKLIGELPQEILSGKRRPDHYKPMRTASTAKHAPGADGKTSAPESEKFGMGK